MKGYMSIDFRGMPVIALEPIRAEQFDDLETFGKLVEEQAFRYIICTQEAWNKYESFITKPKEEK